VLASIFRPAYTRGTQELVNERAIVDGSPFSLPGGDVKLAVGGEFIRQSLDSLLTGNVNGQETYTVPITRYLARQQFTCWGTKCGAWRRVADSITLWSLRPLFGLWQHAKSKFGLTYNPVHWATLRANWGTSFNAPSMADGGGATDTRAVLLNIAPFAIRRIRPQTLIDPNHTCGGNSSCSLRGRTLGPSVAIFKLRHCRIFKVGATYYNIDMTSQIAIIPLFTAAAFLPAYSQYSSRSHAAQTQAWRQASTTLRMLHLIAPYMPWDSPTPSWTRAATTSARSSRTVDFNVYTP